VGAEFDDASAMQHGDAVRIAHGGDAVGDEDGGASRHHVAQVVEDLVFGVGVDAGERVVKDQDPWIPNQRAGDRCTLLLSAGERDAALADQSFVTLRKSFDVDRNIGGVGGIVNVGVAG